MNKPPINWITAPILTLTFLAAITIVPYYAWTVGFDTFEILVALGFLVWTEMSITGGYHRLWSHKSYQAKAPLRLLFAIGGALSVQNRILVWASDHRRHHRYVDDAEKDPYAISNGLWFAHIGWMLRHYKSSEPDISNAKDLEQDPIVMWQYKHYVSLALFMNVAVPLLIGYLHGDLWGTFLLAGLARLVVSHHFTWFINSLAHYWGKQPYSLKNSARDNWFISLFTFGEGYHNYHHAFQWDYRNGVKWWQWDPTKWLIYGCSWIGLTSNLKVCERFKIEQSILELEFSKAVDKLDSLINGEQWQKQLHEQYDLIMRTLTEWQDVSTKWSQAKSDKLKKGFELNQLKEKVAELSQLLDAQKRDWNLLTAEFS